MKWVGLTGGIATGKSTVAQILRESSVPVVDADALVHRILSSKGEGYQSIVSHFGESILLPSGDIDRGILGSIVFQNSEKLTELESILHPLVQLASQEERLRRIFERSAERSGRRPRMSGRTIGEPPMRRRIRRLRRPQWRAPDS